MSYNNNSAASASNNMNDGGVSGADFHKQPSRGGPPQFTNSGKRNAGGDSNPFYRNKNQADERESDTTARKYKFAKHGRLRLYGRHPLI